MRTAVVLWASVLISGWTGNYADSPRIDELTRFVQTRPNSTWGELDWQHWLMRTQSDKFIEEDFTTVDGSKVDIMSKDTTYEIDYCLNKWKEAVGQSLFYSIATGKKPGIILLMGKSNNAELEKIHYLRCLAVCAKFDIELIAIKMKDHY